MSYYLDIIAILEFLQSSYVNIVSSKCGSKYPRIVTQVLPFISKQVDEKSALVVVDGMNYWQALLLTRSLEDRLKVKAKYDCIYAWLPSVTELSRQAIFRGVPAFQQYYHHSGNISEEMSVNRLGYVAVDLDEKTHTSDNYMYLYDATKRWVAEKGIVGNIRHLIDGGYKVYIVTDHGNIETTAYRNLDSRDKIGASQSLRHITHPKEADKVFFETQYEGHLVQVDRRPKLISQRSSP